MSLITWREKGTVGLYKRGRRPCWLEPNEGVGHCWTALTRVTRLLQLVTGTSSTSIITEGSFQGGSHCWELSLSRSESPQLLSIAPLIAVCRYSPPRASPQPIISRDSDLMSTTVCLLSSLSLSISLSFSRIAAERCTATWDHEWLTINCSTVMIFQYHSTRLSQQIPSFYKPHYMLLFHLFSFVIDCLEFGIRIWWNYK